MEFSELVKIRQSDRTYLDREVEPAKMELILEAARLAPSSNNSQPWRFLVVDDPALRAAVADCASDMGLNKFVARAPAIIVIVLEKANVMSRIGSVIQDKEYSLLDIGIVANQICLQAADLDLGTCMVGWFREKRLKELLGVDKKRRIPLMITVGYTDGATRPKSRKSAGEVIEYNPRGK